MSTEPLLPDPPDIDHLVTEDEAPLDNIPSEKQQRLLTEPLYSSWPGPGDARPFLAAANVGVFASVRRPPIVPDVLLALDVEPADDLWEKQHRTYFAWEFGKVPDVVIEIVSNREGGETTRKLKEYAWCGMPYYAIFDPQLILLETPLVVYELRGRRYELRADATLGNIGLGLVLWEGTFERKRMTWLRWCDLEGRLIPTGAERAEEERQRAEEERQRAEGERQRAERAEAETARLARLLREAGVDPDRSL